MPELPDVFAEFFDNKMQKILNDTLIDPNRYVFRKAGASSKTR